jgi:RNA polymerase sigma-70 factor (ECF subfamily)
VTKLPAPFVYRVEVPRDRDDRLDRELLRRLASGDAGALGDLYDRHAASLFRHGVALSRRPAEAEDLVQAVFVSLAMTGADLLAVRTPASYLHRMLRSAWLDGRRRVARAREQPLPEIADDDRGEIPSGFPAQVPSNEAAALDVERALRMLPDDQREVVALHLVEGFSFREIGRMTGVSMWTVTGRYRLAIGRLRQVLG